MTFRERITWAFVGAMMIIFGMAGLFAFLLCLAHFPMFVLALILLGIGWVFADDVQRLCYRVMAKIKAG